LFQKLLLICLCAIAISVAAQAPAQGLPNKKPVVFIWSESTESGKRRPLGSGFLLGEEGDVLTARHVVEKRVTGERLVVSIASKSSFPVAVDMSDVECGTTQDFCFIRIPKDVVAERVSEFYPLGCYRPEIGTPLMAAGFFAGDDPQSGIVTPRGNLIGDPIAGGLMPTDMPLEQGMSGGPVFDDRMNVVGIVKGGSTQFAYVQPLQRARSMLIDRGLECNPSARQVPVVQDGPAPSEQPMPAVQPGPATCLAGFVWREARDGDTVCVTPETREQTRMENAVALENRADPSGNSATCKSGYVWREAFDGDSVCVTPDRREQAWADNGMQEQRVAQ
jgi:hypothetical protein